MTVIEILAYQVEHLKNELEIANKDNYKFRNLITIIKTKLRTDSPLAYGKLCAYLELEAKQLIKDFDEIK